MPKSFSDPCLSTYATVTTVLKILWFCGIHTFTYISFHLPVSAMPASKAKSASANGSASGKTTKGTPASTVPPSPVSKPLETDHVVTNGSGRPDKSAYDAEQERLKSEIDVVQVKLVRCIPVVVPAVADPIFKGRRPRENNLSYQAFGQRQTECAPCGT